MGTIKDIRARQILDSRGNPTVEVDLLLSNGIIARAAVPSGASTGTKEALELRDEKKNVYMGKGVLLACEHIKNMLLPALKGKDITQQRQIDQTMLELDGTEYKSKIGANAILGVSLAAAKAGAFHAQLPLYRYLREKLQCPVWHKDYLLPRPLMNIINGGAHASNNLDIQEFMITPKKSQRFGDNLRAGVEIFHHLKKVLAQKKFSTAVGDEGGFAPNFDSSEEVLQAIAVATENAGYKVGSEIEFSLDVAASEFYQDEMYNFENQRFTSEQMIHYFYQLKQKYPLFSIEDGLSELDQKNWSALNQKLSSNTLIIGDDLYVTNKKILAEGIKHRWSNAILIKVNQIGTLTETFETLELAKNNGMKAIISHRSGETADSFIADLAVATSCGFIKTGSACRTDRVEKYNQLLRIEEELT